MKLYTALVHVAAVLAEVLAFSENGAARTKALEIAESLDDAEYQLRLLWGLFSLHLGIGEFQIALEMAQKFRTLAAQRQRRNDELIGERLLGSAQHVLGDQVSARRHIEHMLADSVRSDQRSHEAFVSMSTSA